MRCEDVRPEIAVLSELDDSSRGEVEAHISSCASCREEKAVIEVSVELLRKHAAAEPSEHMRSAVLGAIEMDKLAPALGLAVERPAPKVKSSVMQAIEDEQRGSGSENVIKMPSLRERLGRNLAVAATLLILGAGIGWALGGSGTPTRPVAEGPEIPEGHETQTLTLDGMGPDELEVRHYRHDNFRLTLSVEGFAPTPAGFHYAVWARGESGDVALGTFRLKREDDFEIPFAMGVNPSDFSNFAVTLEPNDGDPTLQGRSVTQASFDLETVHHGTYDD